MAEEVARILADALKLPPEARAALAGSLLDSLDEETDEDAEAAWDQEIARRLRDIQTGAVETIPWAEARQRLRDRFVG